MRTVALVTLPTSTPTVNRRDIVVSLQGLIVCSPSVVVGAQSVCRTLTRMRIHTVIVVTVPEVGRHAVDAT
jgi:hypothetical protein